MGGERHTREVGGYSSKETWEEKSCEQCGYKRKVKVRRNDVYMVTTERQLAPNKSYNEDVEVHREYVRTEEMYSEVCTACEYTNRARTLQRRATQHLKTASRIRAKRTDTAHKRKLASLKKRGENNGDN